MSSRSQALPDENKIFSFFQKYLLTKSANPAIMHSVAGHNRAGIAQLVEQLICNQQVGGSSPSTSSNLPQRQIIPYWETFWRDQSGSVPEWPKGADCKSVVDDFGGSNPPAPTKNRSELVFRTVLLCTAERLQAPQTAGRFADALRTSSQPQRRAPQSIGSVNRRTSCGNPRRTYALRGFAAILFSPSVYKMH